MEKNVGGTSSMRNGRWGGERGWEGNGQGKSGRNRSETDRTEGNVEDGKDERVDEKIRVLTLIHRVLLLSARPRSGGNQRRE